jgi:hypothetical protein
MLPDFRLAVTFCDGRNGIIDCATILTSTNPGIYAPLTTSDFFAQVKLELGALTWPNGADLDPRWLHAELADRKSWSVPFSRRPVLTASSALDGISHIMICFKSSSARRRKTRMDNLSRASWP